MQTTIKATEITASAVKCVLDNTDLTGTIVSFYATSWDLRSLIVSRSLKDIVRARVRRSLYICNAEGVWRVCVATGHVEKMAATPFHGTGLVRPGEPERQLRGHQATMVDGVVVVAGAMIDQQFVWRFDPLDSTWQELPSMLGGRGVHSLASVGGRIFALGGKSSTGFNGYPMELLDVRGGATSWHPIGPQHYGIMDWCMHAGTGSGNYMYAVGGSRDTGHEYRFTDSELVHRMDATTGAWEVVASMTHPRSCLTVCGRSDGDFYALGGRFIEDGSSDSDEEYDFGPQMIEHHLKVVERYCVSEDSWTTLSPMRDEGDFVGAAVADGTLWAVIKQEDSEGEGAIFLDKYDPSVDAWVQKHALPLDAIPFIKFGPPHARGYSNTFSGFA